MATVTATTKIYSRLWRAIIEFDMIQSEDRILIGLSGGKDSIFLLHSLAHIRKFCPQPFTLGAITIDPQFSNDFPLSQLADYCRSLQVPFFYKKVNIASIIKKQSGNDPCFTCAYFRRGAVNNFAANNNFNKVALAHHHDDAVETFLMSIMYSGQIQTFRPVTKLDRCGIEVIRPLIYYRENQLKIYQRGTNFQPIKSPCPIDGHTRRQTVKEQIQQWEKTNPSIYHHLASAMRQHGSMCLWPDIIDRSILKQRFEKFWHKKQVPFLSATRGTANCEQ